VRRQIQVRNVDRLAYSIVTEARGTPVIADERVLRGRWADAAAAFGLELTSAFLKNEWEQVILAQDLRSEHAYLSCLRTGRGRPLTKAQRSRVWQAAQQVTAELATARQTTHLQLANEATHLLREAGAKTHGHHGSGAPPSSLKWTSTQPHQPGRSLRCCAITQVTSPKRIPSPTDATGSLARKEGVPEDHQSRETRRGMDAPRATAFVHVHPQRA